MDDPGRLVRALTGDLARELPAMLAMTERLVAIDSGSLDVAGVAAVSEAVGEALAGIGFTLERTPVPDCAPLVTAVRDAGAGPRVLVLGHADTVWPAGTAADWPFRRLADRIEGPGVGDMKACLVMACFALGALAAQGLLDRVRVTFLLVPDEELGSTGSRPAIERAAAEADVCLGLEAASPGGAVVVERGAVGAMIIRANGRTAHMTDEPPGASAVSALAPLVAQVEGASRPAEGLSVGAGIFMGGTARQVVPADAELHLDLRARDAGSAEALERRVRELAGEAARPGVRIAVEGGFTRPAWTLDAGGERLFALAEAAGAALDEPVVAHSERGGSDASFAGTLGVATLDGLGPICHDSCSRRESVEVSSIPRRGAVFGAVLAHAGGVSP